MWFKVDDQLAFHRKVIRAGNAAMGLWVRAGSYARSEAGYKPDAPGVLTYDEARTMGTAAEVKRLIDAGLWVATRYQGRRAVAFHEWEDRQPSRDELGARREAWATRKRRSRKHAAGDHDECLPEHCDAASRPGRGASWP